MEICEIEYHGKPICEITGAKVQRINSYTVLVNGAIVDFPDAVSITWISETDVRESKITQTGEIENV